MATPAADPKSAPLAEDLKEFAHSLPTTAFPKNFFCTLCNQLAVDSWKLLCCNKAICSSCQSKLHFPTTCPSCDHSPLEADSCVPNKALRNTMRVWLEKRKKKEETKAAAQVATPPVEMTPAEPEALPAGDAPEKPIESVEEASKAEDSFVELDHVAVGSAGDVVERTVSASAQPNEEIASVQAEMERSGSTAPQSVMKSTELSATNGPTDGQNPEDVSNVSMMGNNPMMNGMQGQMGFGFPNQAGFNNGMGWNGMNQMNGMPNMMANGNWNEYGNMNGMYGNFGGNMGMGMNDMSAMNMMNYGGGFGNGWNGMGGGYGFNGQNQMGGYNQSGAYPEMMNQFPKNNFPNQNQNRFHANQGGAYPQRNNRNGSYGGSGPGFQNASSRPESHSALAHNQRDGQSPDGTANPAPEAKAEGAQTGAPAEPTEEGKENADGAPQAAHEATAGTTGMNTGDGTNPAGGDPDATIQGGGLNKIQTVDSGDVDAESFAQSTMGNGMQSNMAYAHGMMNQAQMNSFDPNMNMNMGYHSNNNYVSRGGFNNGAYGAATVLTGQPAEPVGMGVVGAPTGPRAMREGRPNTGFSSRVNSTRYNPVPKSVTPAQEAAPGSPQRRVRSRSPLRDESLRVKERSVTRSRSRSKSRPRDDDKKEEQRERSRSGDRESRREDRGRSLTPNAEEDYDHRKERRQHRSSRHDERGKDYDDRHRDDRDSRGNRTRSTSVESKYRSSRRDKDKHRSSRSHRDRSKEHRRRHRSRSFDDDKYDDDDAYKNGEKESDGSSRRKHRSSDKEKYRERDRSRDKERDRDRKDRKERDRDYDYDREKDRARDKDKDRRRRRDREAEDDERDYDDDKHRSSRRSRKDRDRERDRDDDRDDRDLKEKSPQPQKEEDVVGQMMKKRAVSPPLNAPKGPSGNGFSIKGRSKNVVMAPPTQAPSGPRAFQPPKGPAADRNKERADSRDHRRKSSASSLPSGPATPTGPASTMGQDHYAAERERNARERDSREKVDKSQRDVVSKSLHSRIHASSRPSLSSKRSRDDIDTEERSEGPRSDAPPRGPKADIKAPTGPASHRDKRRKSGATGDDNIANLFAAGLRKNAKARRGGVRTEGDVEREMERVERERERR
ncbi:hypothetical protein BKA66DRAFT_468187 [Pyrenochaeta sp. MPI-SDFR-AT-0127]|nr:hypothetical protein BKA66DRAFT_468187 [Pyrenochaeta sp. MPI-SDFR-AT-0127]